MAMNKEELQTLADTQRNQIEDLKMIAYTLIGTMEGIAVILPVGQENMAKSLKLAARNAKRSMKL